jgi:hypothetical protein
MSGGSQWPARYEIRVGEVLDGHWSVWFEGLEVRGEAGETVISGPLQDESAFTECSPRFGISAFTSSPCAVWDPRRREEETVADTVILRGERGPAAAGPCRGRREAGPDPARARGREVVG